MGWGNAQTPDAVSQTANVTQNLTPERLQNMIDHGLNKEWLTEQKEKYEANLAAGKLSDNAQALPRLTLIRKILTMWPQ